MVFSTIFSSLRGNKSLAWYCTKYESYISQIRVLCIFYFKTEQDANNKMENKRGIINVFSYKISLDYCCRTLFVLVINHAQVEKGPCTRTLKSTGNIARVWKVNLFIHSFTKFSDKNFTFWKVNQVLPHSSSKNNNLYFICSKKCHAWIIWLLYR